MTDIVDAHHHIWRQNDLPWLVGPMQPRIFGPYEAIRRDYPIDEYRADAEAAGVRQSVYVQTNWAKADFEREVEWVSEVNRQTGWPHAIVAYADLGVDDARAHLDRLAKHPLVRGVRMQLHWHENPMYRFAERADLCDDPALQRNVARLADYGWAFDLQVFAPQMEGAARLARAAPRTTLVLQHAGMLEDRSAQGMTAWREGLRRLGAEPNVAAKLSGLGTFLHRNDPAHIGSVLAETAAAFGAERCLFGSNFPIEKLWTHYGDLVAAYLKALEGFPAPERHAMLAATARRIYRL